MRKRGPRSPECIAKISASKKGRPHSDEHKANISEAVVGEKNPMFGRKHSEETKRKMSEAKRLKKIKAGYYNLTPIQILDLREIDGG